MGVLQFQPNLRLTMKTVSILPAAVLAFVVASPFAVAQDSSHPAPVAAPAASASLTDLPVANHLVYLAKLPARADLAKDAQVKGLTITRIDQTADSVVVVYQAADGRTDTFAYTILAAESTADETGVALAVPAPPQTVITAGPPATTTVVYREPETIYYAGPRYVRYYDPYANFWAPLAVGFGIGWVSGGHGHGGHHHGRWHR